MDLTRFLRRIRQITPPIEVNAPKVVVIGAIIELLFLLLVAFLIYKVFI